MLDLAARERGLRADITLFPEGEFGPEKIDRRPVARIRLAPDPGVARDPLFAQVLLRRTSREKCDAARAIPAEAVRAMAESLKPHAVRFSFAGTQEPALLARHRAVASEAWMIELTTPRTILESSRCLRVVAGEIEKHRDGLSMQPLSQALQEYPEQRKTYARIHELAGAATPGQTVQMWARVDFGPRVQQAPRRGVAAHVVRG